MHGGLGVTAHRQQHALYGRGSIILYSTGWQPGQQQKRSAAVATEVDLLTCYAA